MSLLGMKGGTGIGTDPRFLGSIWTQIWTWLDSNPVIGVEIYTKYARILFTYYIIILGGGGGGPNTYCKFYPGLFQCALPTSLML